MLCPWHAAACPPITAWHLLRPTLAPCSTLHLGLDRAGCNGGAMARSQQCPGPWRHPCSVPGSMPNQPAPQQLSLLHKAYPEARRGLGTVGDPLPLGFSRSPVGEELPGKPIRISHRNKQRALELESSQQPPVLHLPSSLLSHQQVFISNSTFASWDDGIPALGNEVPARSMLVQSSVEKSSSCRTLGAAFSQDLWSCGAEPPPPPAPRR